MHLTPPPPQAQSPTPRTVTIFQVFFFFVLPELIGLLLPGVQSHLGSTDIAVRSRGMLVAQLLTKAVDPTGQQIEFDVSVMVFTFSLYFSQN